MNKILKAVCALTIGVSMFCILTGCDGSSNSGNYDRNDGYYRDNDHNNDGYINDNEFQDAVGDYLDDHGY